MIPSQFRPLLRAERIATGLASFTFGLLFSVLANFLSGDYAPFLPALLLVAVVTGLAALYFFWKRPVITEVTMKPPQVYRRPQDAGRFARRGYIGFVPLYNPRDSAARALSPTERLQAAERLDFERLPVVESNLYPTAAGITAHRERLEHCWLLSTQGELSSGSLPYAPFLAAYLKEQIGVDCEFHYGPDYTISLDDDALLVEKTYWQVKQVIEEALALGLSPQSLVIDFTTGTRSMVLGMILASLHRDYDVEFIGTRYNERGQPEGTLVPMIFSFEPQLRND